MPTFGEEVKSEVAKQLVAQGVSYFYKIVFVAVFLAIAAGGLWFAKGYIASGVTSAIASIKRPFSASAEKIGEAKDAMKEGAGNIVGKVREKTPEVLQSTKERASDFKDTVVETAGATAQTVREKAPEMLDKTKELTAEGVAKAKEVGAGAMERFRNWRNRDKEEPQIEPSK